MALTADWAVCSDWGCVKTYVRPAPEMQYLRSRPCGVGGLAQLQHDVERWNAGASSPVEVRAPADGVVSLLTARCAGRDLVSFVASGCSGGDALGAKLQSVLQAAVLSARALADLHQAGLVHHNLKPSNIFLRQRSATLIDPGSEALVSEVLKNLRCRYVLERVLPYLAPEQTGRMGRAVDSRADLYAFGIALYEVLAGAPPFSSSDPLEIIHAHLARRPPSLERRSSGLPQVLGRIVGRLLEKDPERRYQSAHGLLYDLERCLEHYQGPGTLATFPLGRADVARTLLLEGTLCGRSSERAVIEAALDESSSGRAGLLLLAGPPGIGKSALARWITRSASLHGCCFGQGKCDQLGLEQPYGVLRQALTQVVEQLLFEREEVLEAWRRRFRDTVGGLGGVLVELYPALERVVGPQSCPAPLDLVEARARMQLAVQRLASVIASRERPLLLFLDDLQWADGGSLELLEALLAPAASLPILVIGTYRNTEVSESHPLLLAVRAIEARGLPVRTHVLGPLSPESIAELLSLGLGRSVEEVRDLASAVHDKTLGNPFFARVFLESLVARGLLEFQRGWNWSLEAIRAEPVTDNVVTLLCERLRHLPGETRRVLQYAAVCGADTLLADLMSALGCDRLSLLRNLEPAVSASLVRVAAGRVAFQHDRVQEAALSLVAPEQLAALHLEIAKAIGEHSAVQQCEAPRLFAQVSHLNAGRSALPDAQRLELARMNLIALASARASAAFGTAIELARAGIECLKPQDWEANYALAFELNYQYAELTFHRGDFEAAQALAVALEECARHPVEAASAKGLLIKQYIVQARFDETIETARQALALVGVDLPVEPSQVQARFALERARTERMLNGREPAALSENPAMRDPAARLALELLVRVNPAIFFQRPDMLGLNIVLMTNLSLEYGHTPVSAFAYAEFGFLCALESEDRRRAYDFTLLGLRLATESRDPIQICRVTHLAAWIQHYVRPLPEADAFFQKGFQAGSESGETEWAAYHAYSRSTRILLLGIELRAAGEEIHQLREYVRRANSSAIVQLMEAVYGQIEPLTHVAEPATAAEDAERELLRWQRAGNPQALFIHASYRSFSLLLERRYVAALDHAEVALSQALHAPNHPFVELCHFVRGLASMAGLPRGAALPPIALEAARRFESLAMVCPANYGARRDLLEAELGRVRGTGWANGQRYAAASRQARAAGFVHEEGLAHQLAARFWAELQQPEFSEVHARRALGCWARWGARRLVRLTEAELAREQRPWGILDAQDGFDARSLIKSSQAISGELDRTKLLSRIMHVILENAGAEWGALITPGPSGLQVVVSAGTEGEADLTTHDLGDDSRAIIEVIRYVHRTGERLVLEDAGQDARFSGSSQMQRRAVRSVLCLPLGPANAPHAFLYLENTLVGAAFTKERLATIEVLASQASISLENAALFSRTQRAEQTLRASEEDLRITLDSIGEAVMATDARGCVTRMNPVACKLTGWSLEDARGRALSEVFQLVDASTRDTLADPVQNVLQAAENMERAADALLVSRSGAERLVSDSAAPIRDARGEIVGVVLVFRDVTERHELEERLRQTQKMDALGQLAGGVAHDFNNMLAGILGSAEFLHMKLPKDEYPELAGSLQTITDSALRAAGLTKQLLAFSRKRRQVSARVDLHQVIDEALVLLERSIDRRIRIERALGGGTPYVRGDASLLQTTMLNLGINARDAMPEGGRLRIATRRVQLDEAACQALRVERLEPGEYVEIEVRDSGTGMPPAVLHRIFEPFFTTKAVGQGTGLGLAAVHGTLVQHGGAIRVESSVGRGTTFWLWLPLDRESVSEAPPASWRASARGRSLQVLLVDDEPVARVTAQRLLSSLGHRTILGSDGREAVELFERHHATIDLVLLDWVMPYLDGREVFRRIRDIAPSMPVILLSGYAPDAAIDELLAEGLDGFLMKPYTQAQLVSAVEEALPGAAEPRESSIVTGDPGYGAAAK